MRPLDITFKTLGKSRNEAALPTLLAGLESGQRDVFEGAMHALVERRHKTGHLAVIALWSTLEPSQRKAVAGGRGRMGIALREALLADDDQLFTSACEIAEELDEFELAPTLITLAEQTHGPRSQPALSLALRLVARLEQMAQCSTEARDRQNVDMVRACVLECLERSVERFRQHRCAELIEAFVALAGPESDALRAILESPHHPCFATVVDILVRSQSAAVVHLLMTLLQRVEAPLVIRNVASKRTDAAFTSVLLGLPMEQAFSNLERNLRRMKSLACLEAVDWLQLSDRQQMAAMRLMAITGATDDWKLDLDERLLKEGQVGGRLAACKALEEIVGQRANELIVDALDDADPRVQAAATRQIRERHIPGMMGKLIELSASPHSIVRDAACAALPEFSFDGYLARFDAMDAHQRVSAGSLAARLDRHALERLREEMGAATARRRLRAIQMADAMALATQVADALVERLGDEDHLVRAAAADALAQCTSGDVRSALLNALDDRSPTVQSAARNSLRSIPGDKGDGGWLAESRRDSEETLG